MKQCQVCGRRFDPSIPGDWSCPVAFRGRHIPTDRPGMVYVLHFDEPTHVAEADKGHVQPTRHYVGWTGQPVDRRLRQHRVPVSAVVLTGAGTAQDEQAMKRDGRCPGCGAALATECLGGRG